MQDSYIQIIQKETEQTIRRLETSEEPIMSKSLAVSLYLESVFEKLKQAVSCYTFPTEQEEITFFKEIKPRIFCKLIYYRKIYNIEMNRPVSGPNSIRSYLNRELEHIHDYNCKRLDFYRYYRSGASHLDRVYFLRNASHDVGQYFDSFYFERDPLFSTSGDFRVAKILAGDMLSRYLIHEMDELDKQPHETYVDVRLVWADSKTDLCELIFALNAKRAFGDIPLTQLANQIQKVFHIEVNSNLSRTFSDLSLRNNPTPYLDSLTDSLLEKMKRPKRKR